MAGENSYSCCVSWNGKVETPCVVSVWNMIRYKFSAIRSLTLGHLATNVVTLVPRKTKIEISKRVSLICPIPTSIIR
jgi:hypothetical protein